MTCSVIDLLHIAVLQRNRHSPLQIIYILLLPLEIMLLVLSYKSLLPPTFLFDVANGDNYITLIIYRNSRHRGATRMLLNKIRDTVEGLILRMKRGKCPSHCLDSADDRLFLAIWFNANLVLISLQSTQLTSLFSNAT